MDRRRMLSLVFQFQERRTCCNQLMAGNTHRCTMAKSLGNLWLKLFFVMALSRGIILDLQVRSCLQTTLPLCQQFFCFGHVPNCEAHVTGIVYFEGGRRQCCPMRKMPRRWWLGCRGRSCSFFTGKHNYIHIICTNFNSVCKWIHNTSIIMDKYIFHYI